MTVSETGARPPHSSGITVLVVGLGPAGLATAIECHRRGHKVICLERKPESYHLGDLISLTGNAVRVLEKWGDGAVIRAMQHFQCNLNTLQVYDETGVLKLRKPHNATDAQEDGYMLRRSRLLEIFLEHLKNMGIEIRTGVQVTEYWETDRSAGVNVGDEVIRADCVIAADGVHSKGRAQISGEDFALEATDGAAYRAFFPASTIAQDPEASWIIKDAGDKDCFHTFYGKDIVIMVGTAENHQYIFWSCGHKENAESESDSVEPVLEFIKDWPVAGKLAPLISKTPDANWMNQALFTRPPLKKWVSDKGRMIVVGDAAHPFLPHAGQGANQGIEDAAVVALSLEIAGKNDVPLALRVAEKLRYHRTVAIQKRGVQARDQSLNVDWNKGGFTKTLELRPAWLHDHDCVKQVYEEFSIAADAVRNGTGYTPASGIPSD